MICQDLVYPSGPSSTQPVDLQEIKKKKEMARTEMVAPTWRTEREEKRCGCSLAAIFPNHQPSYIKRQGKPHLQLVAQRKKQARKKARPPAHKGIPKVFATN
jgi:hypothetical protein